MWHVALTAYLSEDPVPTRHWASLGLESRSSQSYVTMPGLLLPLLPCPFPKQAAISVHIHTLTPCPARPAGQKENVSRSEHREAKSGSEAPVYLNSPIPSSLESLNSAPLLSWTEAVPASRPRALPVWKGSDNPVLTSCDSQVGRLFHRLSYRFFLPLAGAPACVCLGLSPLGSRSYVFFWKLQLF